jgi:hypothetical protein
MLSLSDAIQLIRQGRKEEARQALEPLLRAEPGNVTAWFWYVETCSTPEKRIQVLEVCLKMNPGNAQVMQALQTLRNQRSPQTSFTPPPVQPPKPAVSQPLQTRSPSYSAMYDEEPKGSVPSANTPIYFDDKPTYSPVATGAASQQSPGTRKKAWEEDNASFVDTSMLSKPRTAATSYTFFDAWVKVMTTMDIESYESVLDDPEAGAGRAFEWVAYTGILSGLMFPLSLVANPQFSELTNMSEFKSLLGNMGSTSILLILALAMALLMPIFSVMSLAIGGGIQNFLAVSFGGNGHYGRTVYALAAYLAPVTLLVALLGIIPFVGQCLTSLISIYSFILSVRALRAAHSISIGQALGVIFAPTIVLMIFGCVIVLLVGLPGLSR